MEREGCCKKQHITVFSHLSKEITVHSRDPRKCGEARVISRREMQEGVLKISWHVL